MMSDRFAPKWPKVRNMLKNLLQALSGTDHLLVEAFSSVADPRLNARTVRDIESQFRAAVVSGIPWVMYDTIVELLRNLPQMAKLSIAEVVRIDTERRYERLRVTPTGRWQVAWEVDPNADPEDREVALDWYVSPNYDDAPIVPIPIIDYVAGCVFLLRENLVLPAAGVLSIALESALWDALTTEGVSRYSEQITYEPVKWHMKRASDKLIVTIDGNVRDINELDSALGDYPSTVSFDLRRMQASPKRAKIGLRLDVDVSLADFFASNKVEKCEQVFDKGLTVAIQKARKENVDCLRIIPEIFDTTLMSLRNNLIHLPSQGNLHEPVPTPTGHALQTMDDLRNNTRLVNDLLPWVVEFINAIYANKSQLENGEELNI